MSSATAPVRRTTASGSAIYESKLAVHEYLQFHYTIQFRAKGRIIVPVTHSRALRYLKSFKSSWSCSGHWMCGGSSKV
ncbi:hypothetical protein PsorP6_011683 [Peronosclerospora sorghi]|uniref:Uncharacterized protein n=1 Tax=Peronosclerospora sorghi TaxID=230839 RepID=A0ACC0WL21_9STRA|nr:hypothetical protein PsorP6_011683 [Peronosclerospora sorghi]